MEINSGGPSWAPKKSGAEVINLTLIGPTKSATPSTNPVSATTLSTATPTKGDHRIRVRHTTVQHPPSTYFHHAVGSQVSPSRIELSVLAKTCQAEQDPAARGIEACWPCRIKPSLLKTSLAKLHQARPTINFGASTGLGISLLYIPYTRRYRAGGTKVPGWRHQS